MAQDLIKAVISLADGAELPTYATEGAAGMDLRLIEPIELQPGERKLGRTGLRMALPPGFEGQVRPRSGLAIKLGLTMINSPGTIDCDYRGEVGILLINHGQNVVQLQKGERVAQLVVAAVPRVEWTVSDDLDATDRGEGGFGSTGTA